MDFEESTSLITYDPVSSNRVNILLFGCSAVGKSCLINTLITDEKAKNVEIRKDAAMRGHDVEKHCTLTFEKYQLNRKVRIFDTWGFTPGRNYDKGEFEKMLEGRYKEKEEAGSNADESPVDDRIIDIVMFVVDGSEGVDENILKTMKEFYEIAKSKGKGVFFVVTKVDLLIEDIIEKENVDSARNICSNGRKFKTEKLKILKHFKSVSVFPMINYEYHADDKIDLITQLKKPVINKIIKLVELPPKGIEYPQKEFVDIFRGEKVEKMEFPRNPKVIQNLKVDLTISTEDESKYIFSDIFFRCVNLGVNTFRLFVSRSLIAPNLDIIGLLEPLTYCYFECCEIKSPYLRPNLVKAFSKDYIPEYMFLSKDGSYDTKLQPSKTTHIRLDLKSQIKPLLFVRKKLEKFHTMIENSVQWMKQIQREEKENAFQEFQDFGEKMKLEQEALKLSFQQLEEKMDQKLGTQKTELQQEIGIKNEQLKRELDAKIDVIQPGNDPKTDQNERSIARIKEVFQHVSERQIFARFFPHTGLSSSHFQWEEAIPNREYFKLENQDVNRGTNVYFQKKGVYTISGFVHTYAGRYLFARKNGSDTFKILGPHGISGTPYYTTTFSCVFEMNVGDYFSLYCSAGGCAYDRRHGSLFIRKLQTEPFHQIHNLNNE